MVLFKLRAHYKKPVAIISHHLDQAFPLKWHHMSPGGGAGIFIRSQYLAWVNSQNQTVSDNFSVNINSLSEFSKYN